MTSFFRENWFWRGTQSAIFFYVSCAPCIDFRYKRKRRTEAARAEKERSEVVSTQPGLIRQPGAFQTNEGWVEEILTGPGPPKGWKTDPIVQRYTAKQKEEIRKRGDQLDGPATGDVSTNTQSTGSRTYDRNATTGPANSLHTTNLTNVPIKEQTNAPEGESLVPNDGPSSERISSDSSTSESVQQTSRPSRPRLSMERRLSSAVDNLKGTLRSTMHSEKWNWKRYEREDEILSGFNQAVTRMWDKATSFGIFEQTETDEKRAGSHGRKRAGTNESDQFDYQRYIRNPEINEMHPPVVSRLPTTRDEAAWMLLPPPSARIMEGKSRPHDEPGLRWPLARIGRSQREWQELRERHERAELEVIVEHDATTESTPDLSDSPSEGNISDDEEDWTSRNEKRHSAPIPGWVPVKRPSIDLLCVRTSREV